MGTFQLSNQKEAFCITKNVPRNSIPACFQTTAPVKRWNHRMGRSAVDVGILKVGSWWGEHGLRRVWAMPVVLGGEGCFDLLLV